MESKPPKTDRAPAQENSSATRVVQLYPTCSSVPFNQLRSYVEFSAAMSEGQVAERVLVFDAMTGLELNDVFLQTSPELWDRARTRLTLLFDPGRIKQGLLPHQELSYPLVRGRAVRVVIDAGFLDAGGQALEQSFERKYEVGTDVRQHVDPSMWNVLPPLAGSLTPLIIDFDRPLDFGLLHHSIRIRARDGSSIGGQVAIGHEECSWALFPNSPWLAGQYRVEVDHRLEDLAGNSVSRVFDRELSRREHDRRGENDVSVSFLVGHARH